jgi:hypothetical protein
MDNAEVRGAGSGVHGFAVKGIRFKVQGFFVWPAEAGTAAPWVVSHQLAALGLRPQVESL